VIDRAALVEVLSVVSHETYMRQAKREGKDPLLYGALPTDHDRERAEDIVVALEQLDVYSPESG
jgi:hypothetical protein